MFAITLPIVKRICETVIGGGDGDEFIIAGAAEPACLDGWEEEGGTTFAGGLEARLPGCRGGGGGGGLDSACEGRGVDGADCEGPGGGAPPYMVARSN